MRNLHFWLVGCFIASILQAVLYKLYLIDLQPEWFKFASRIGDLLYTLSTSYIAGFTLYVFINYLPELRNKNNVKELVKNNIEEIIEDFRDVKNRLAEDTYKLVYSDTKDERYENKQSLGKILLDGNYIDPYNLSKQDMLNICSIIYPKYPSPFHIVTDPINKQSTQLSWEDYLKLNIARIERSINRIFLVMPYLNTEQVRILTKIIDSEYIKFMKDYDGIYQYTNNKDFLFIANHLYDFYKLISELEDNYS